MTTYAPRAHVRRPHVNFWLVAVIGLAAALIGLGAWALVNRYGGGGDARTDATALDDSFFGAASSGDVNAVTATLTSDAVIWLNGTKIVGAGAIRSGFAATPGLHVERTAPVTVDGDFAATLTRFTVPAAGLDEAPLVDVFQFQDGKILRMWVSPPFDNPVMP